MRYFKNPKIATKEGFSLREIKTFPSYEWGEDGGIQADIYYKGVKVGTLHNDGNGGIADFYSSNTIDKMLFNTQALACLKRLEPMYSEYSFLREKTPNSVNEDDYDMLVTCIFDKYVQGKRGTI